MLAQLEAAVRAAALADQVEWSIDVRPRRTRLALTIDEYGRLTILAPPHTTPAALTHLLVAKRSWVHRHVGRRAGGPAAPPTKQIADGETFAFLGRQLTLAVAATGDDPGTLAIPRQRGGRPPTAAAVVNWYREQGARWALERAAHWAPRLGLHRLPELQVRDIGRTRWGYYQASDHRVRLHWQLFQAAPEIAENVLVHELVHATRPPGTPHGPAWRQRMDAAITDWRARDRLLNAARPGMWRGDS